MNSKIVGFKRFTSKAGKDFCVANVVTPYTDREKERNNCNGNKVQEVFLPDELYNYLGESDIGKECRLDYELSGNRAYLVGFSVVGHK